MKDILELIDEVLGDDGKRGPIPTQKDDATEDGPKLGSDDAGGAIEPEDDDGGVGAGVLAAIPGATIRVRRMSLKDFTKAFTEGGSACGSGSGPKASSCGTGSCH